MLTVCDIGMCTACNACINICPKNCITMIKNIQDETTYAVIENNRCIHCERCKKVCPINY